MIESIRLGTVLSGHFPTPCTSNHCASGAPRADQQLRIMSLVAEPPDRLGRQSISLLLRGRYTSLFQLAVTSVAGGFTEASFLVVVAQTAVAVANDRPNIEIVGQSLSTTQAIGLTLVLIVLRVALGFLTTWHSSRLTSDVTAEIQRDLAGAFLHATWASQHGERRGRLQYLLTSFAAQGASLLSAITSIVTASFSLLALLAVAIIVDPVVSLVVVAAVFFLGLILRPLRSAVRRQAKTSSRIGMEFATSLSEISELGMEMHVFNVQESTERRVKTLIEVNQSNSRRLELLMGYVPVVYRGLAYMAIVLALAVMTTVDASQLTSASAALLVMLRSLSYGQAVQLSSANLSSSLPFIDVLQTEVDRYRSARMLDVGVPIGRVGDISLDDVSFEYEEASPVLRNVSATIPAHEVVGVIGPSGSGKSTLVQLLLALREPTSGRVLSQGRDISTLSRREWSRRVTFVPQDARLIAGTVAENIRFFREVSDEEVERAARLAQLHDDVMAFKEGYAHQVGESGSHLSGGQQQRLIIARALVENPDLLILDEPTSSLDVRSESLIRQTLDGLRERMTIVIIAHRLSTLDICDRLMVIQDGQLKAFDTPTNLEATSEFYREARILSGLR